MPVEQRFQPRRGSFAWGASLLGVGLVADALWCLTQQQFAVALVVGGVGLERLTYAVAHHWVQRRHPYRLEGVRLDAAGLWFDERDVIRGKTRATLLPGGLLLDANVRRVTRGDAGHWVVVLYSILGTFHWSTHAGEADADTELARVRAALGERAPDNLTPPESTGVFEILPDERAVMWGVPTVVPASVALRACFLLATIAAVPQLATGTASAMLWAITGVTVLLLGFPLAGAAGALRRAGRIAAEGFTLRGGELRALERSAVTHVAPVQAIEHIGLAEFELGGGPVALRLVAHLRRDATVEAIVPRSTFAHLAQQSLRALAAMHEPQPDDARWLVRLPGGIAEAIEAASWAQRFVAEAQSDSV